MAKVDVTDRDSGPVNDPLYVKALVVTDGTTVLALVTVDAVAIAEIGSIRNEYLANVRQQLEAEIGLKPESLLVNASHCHGRVVADIDALTVQAVKAAHQAMVPVVVGSGRGHEDRVMENRRLLLKSGRQADVRHAYSLPPDEEIAETGPVDPTIGLLRLDRTDGTTLAVVYNFACHPIQGVPNGGNTADMTGFSSKVLEEAFGPNAMAFFLQGCGGDINPALYKDFSGPRNAEPLGNMLGMSALQGAKKIVCEQKGPLVLRREMISLPRADYTERIDHMQKYQLQLLGSLQGTTLNMKSFLPLFIQQGISAEFPSYASHRYLHDRKLGRIDLDRFDEENRRHVQQYLKNVHTMEELTRLQTNLNLLKKHQAKNAASGSRTIDVEVLGVRLGDFVLVTFPGELTVQIGLNLKERSPHPQTFVAGYTNGYIYYAPTKEQALNIGSAQEDSDCLLAPDWQEIFEAKALEILKGI